MQKSYIDMYNFEYYLIIYNYIYIHLQIYIYIYIYTYLINNSEDNNSFAQAFQMLI